MSTFFTNADKVHEIQGKGPVVEVSHKIPHIIINNNGRFLTILNVYNDEQILRKHAKLQRYTIR